MLLKKKFILASNSISRYRLLKNAGLDFLKKSPLCDEALIKKTFNKKTNIFNLAKFLAKEKARSIIYKNKLVVGSDTIIIFQNKIINKATNMAEAKNKLKKLSGKNHQIISAVSVCYDGKQIWSAHQKSTITMIKLTEKEIDQYLNLVGKDILMSVGCYQAEKIGPQIIKSIKGDFFNVLGFPLFPFLLFLKKYK
jgi:septum formation protein